ncbi:MAG: hypothetical protein M3N52_03505 [Actinomycetota bacterium]|nr:hypothetical protein [Actinomycetota bacterium]
MGNLQVKNIPEDVHAELRRRAAQAGMTVRDYVLGLIRRDQSMPSRQDWVASVRRRRPVVLDRPVAEVIAEQRAGRDGRW